MINHGSIKSDITQLIRDPGFQSEAAQIQAKALLSEIAEEVPAYRWSYVARRIVRNITLTTVELERLALEGEEHVEELSAAAHRFASLWESLAKLEEATNANTALLNAAINYEMAGFQANSFCLAERLTPKKEVAHTPSFIELAALFLQRRFLRITQNVQSAWRQPDEEHFSVAVVEQMAYATAARALSRAVLFFLGGDRAALDDASTLLTTSEELFAGLGLVRQSNLSRGLRSILPVMESRSTWNLLGNLHLERPGWVRYLKLLARGVNQHILESRSVSELWPSQITALRGGLLSSTSSKIIRMPTSAGKTRIAELAIVHTLLENPDVKCIYVAPYRALVSEVENTFLSLLSDLGLRISSVVGSFETDDFEEMLLRDTDLLVTTPEKLDLVLRSQPEFLENLRLVVLDEVQIVDDWRRGAKFELLLTRLRTWFPEVRILTLSAVIPEQTLRDFADWFNASTADDLLTSDWRPATQRYAKLEWTGTTGVMRYSRNVDIQLLNEFVPGVIRQQMFEFVNPETSRINRRRFPDVNHKAQIAAETAYRFAELGPVLIFCAQTNFANAVAKALEERLELIKLTDRNVPHYFQEKSNRRSALMADEWLGDHPITSWLKKGIGIHYGPLPDSVRTAVENDYRQRHLRVLVATNTLAQGVNLPVRTVIVHSCWRYNVDEGRQERMAARDFWNIAGRAGRAGEETEGLIIHIKVSDQDERDFQYFQDKRENVETVESALYQRLVELVEGRMTEEALHTDLDPEILALVAEESGEVSIEEMTDRILGESLVGIQARRNRRPLARLSEVVANLANSLTTRIPDLEDRTVFSSTGLSSSSCLFLYETIRKNFTDVQNLLLNSTAEDLDGIIDMVVPTCLSLAEMQPDYEYGGSYTELVNAWVGGMHIRELTSAYGVQAGSKEDFGRFVDDLIRYRLPWGVAGYLRIACLVFGTERSELSDYARFLPSMLKFGLPDPVACWAMTSGISYRHTALRMAAAYRDETAISSYESFRHWLATVSSERLYYDFGLRSPILEDVSRAITVSGVNRLINQFTALENLLPIEVEVQGIGYENRFVTALQAKEGQHVTLVRDFDNLVDRNAVAVELLGSMLGYVPREVAQVLAPEIDSGVQLGATVTSVTQERLPRVSIQMTLNGE